MSGAYVRLLDLPRFSLWEKMKKERSLFSFDFEITARCNNNCRHCYINLPANDKEAREKELSLNDIKEIVDEAVSLGAIWCVLTGGEPLLRDDFFEIYHYLKQKGLLVSVFTNATLIREEHVRLFKKYPPRDIEVSVYGVSEKTYEQVTRKKGSFQAFLSGLELLQANGIKFRLKAMVIRSNVGELPDILRFGRAKSKDYFRIDPFLHFRFDKDASRNREIQSERLSASEIATVERLDPDRMRTMKNQCEKLIVPDQVHYSCTHLFHCGAGIGNFNLSYDGLFRLCSSLWHADCVYDLKRGNLTDAYRNFIPDVREKTSERIEFLDKCQGCALFNLCMWCPGNADLEVGALDAHVDYFCEVAHERKKMIIGLDDEDQGSRQMTNINRKGGRYESKKDVAKTSIGCFIEG